MSSSRVKAPVAPRAVSVECTDTVFTVVLADGRSISIPLDWYPRLAHGRPDERMNWEIIGDGDGIHWPALDEDIGVEGLLEGLRSAESPASFERWLAARSR